MLRRWMIFNVVGWLGIPVQPIALWVLTGWLGLNYLLGTALAVESAILHNFVWHERWTWSDRTGKDKPGVWLRLLRFHFANGGISLAGNLILMRVFVGTCAMNPTVGNALAIVICSLANFLASDRFVFSGYGHLRVP